MVTIVGHALPVLFEFKKSWKILKSVIHYLAYAPTYVHLLIIYAFCRIDDLSWGTKGLDTSTGSKMDEIE